MRTIRLEKADKSMPLPSGSPFSLYSTDELTPVMGEIRHIHTGYVFYLPNDLELVIRMVIPELSLLKFFNESPSQLTLVTLCSGMTARITKGQKVATAYVREVNRECIRFAEFAETGRIITGSPMKTS